LHPVDGEPLLLLHLDDAIGAHMEALAPSRHYQTHRDSQIFKANHSDVACVVGDTMGKCKCLLPVMNGAKSPPCRYQ